MAPDPLALLMDGTAEVVPEGELAEKLALGRPLRVKLGLDPTASDVTLGWAVVLHKLRQFQDAGHVAVLIVGDFTARVGDPSGKSETRPRLDKDVVKAYAERLLEQFGLILSSERLEVRYNSEWLERMDMEAVLRLTSSYTVARMLERDDFAARYADGRPISIMEFMYPLLQGYDSVAVEADIELGGTDQLFNLLVGRELQRSWNQAPQVAMTMPLLEGLDGVQKMSQSLGNYVGITEPPDEMFGKLMRIPDGLIGKYLWSGRVAAGRRGRWRRGGPRGRVVEGERPEAGDGPDGGRPLSRAGRRGTRGGGLQPGPSRPGAPRGGAGRSDPRRGHRRRGRVAAQAARGPGPGLLQRRRAPADRAGRGQAGRRAGHRSRPTRHAATSWPARSCRSDGVGSAVWPSPG